MPGWRVVFGCGLVGCLLGLPFASSTWGADLAGRSVEFNRDVRPILSAKCFQCHGPDANSRKADLRLDRRDDALAAIEPGQPGDSELVRRISSNDPEEQMPPAKFGKTLTPAEITLLKEWIQQGAPWQKHWSLIPPVRSAVPQVKDSAGTHNAVDHFIRARLETEGLSPSPPAERTTLIRRLSFDLLGLPPAIDDVEAFLADESPNAYEKLVERYLSSPHFGERIAMHWLDLVRYADTVGYHGDQDFSVWPYRDYVIRAFNDNLPFDRFTLEQIAGDLLPGATRDQKVASGYNRLNMITAEGGAQPKEYLAKYAADRVRTTSTVWMATTLGCCECHDHKFDAFTMRDFYSFEAFFADLKEKGFYGGAHRTGIWGPHLRLPTPKQQATLAQHEKAIADLEAALKSASADKKTVEKDLEAAKQSRDAFLKTIPVSLVSESVKPRVMRILPRGNWLDESGPIVTASLPESLQPAADDTKKLDRRDLGRWLASADNPLVARAFVNRIWRTLFGSGLSKILDDLGVQGEWPVHAELLDWLAVESIESGWDVKHLLRTIVTSATYRQSSAASRHAVEVDPYNRLLARQSRFRLDAEFIRDNSLAVSGLLVRRLGGRSVRPYQPPGYYAQLNFPRRVYKPDENENQHRRGLYTHWQRTFLHPMLVAFDAPSREECTAERARSNTPLAALALLNDPSFVEAARVFAQRILLEGGESFEERLDFTYRHALSRSATDGERKLLAKLFKKQKSRYSADPQAAAELCKVGIAPVADGLNEIDLAVWTTVARTVLNLHETITRY